MTNIENGKILHYIEDKAKNKFNIIRDKSIVQGFEKKYHPQTHLLYGYTKFFFKSIKCLDDNKTIEIISNYDEYEVTLDQKKELKYSGEQIIFSNYNDIISNFLIAKPSVN